MHTADDVERCALFLEQEGILDGMTWDGLRAFCAGYAPHFPPSAVRAFAADLGAWLGCYEDTECAA